ECIYEHEYVASPKVRIVSGSAITVDKELLENIAPGKVSFQATAVELKQAESEFYSYLCDLDPRLKRDTQDERVAGGPQIAFLSETSTVFGQRARDEFPKKEREDAQTERARDANRNENEPAEREQLPVLYLTFPLHISQLRVEAAKISLA